MKKLIVSAILFCNMIIQVKADLCPQIINIVNRQYESLDGQWRTINDIYENGYYDMWLKESKEGFFLDRPLDKTKLQEYNFDDGKMLYVPGDWNTQRLDLLYYEGTIWYRKRFNTTVDKEKRQFIYFGAVNYEAVVYLNGQKIGTHVGGFTPFNIEVSNFLKDGENSLVVKVDNKRHKEGVPSVNSDWWNYGGITREVKLVTVPKTFIRDYFIQLDKNNAKLISGWVQLDGLISQDEVMVNIPELGIQKKYPVDKDGKCQVNIPLKNITLWEPQNPKTYTVIISCSGDKVEDKIGFRTIDVHNADLLLNGKKIFLRGICLHEESAYSSSRTYSREEVFMLLNWAKELGCNFVRLAHYTHNENMIKVAEELGLMLWCEIPVYWTIQWENQATYNNAEAQLVDMITRDKNRANVLIWSVANETPISESRLNFLVNLIKKARSLDNTRLITAAMQKEEIRPNEMTVNDPLNEYLDLVSFNQYIGWYWGKPEFCDQIKWTMNINKPVFVSEFGGCALFGYHDSKEIVFTEEYQENLYEHSIQMLQRIPNLTGTSPWILVDFRSPRRQLSGIQDEFNRKGLISNKGQKKKAFFVLQNWYNEIRQHESK